MRRGACGRLSLRATRCCNGCAARFWRNGLAVSQYLPTHACEVAKASATQPFAYLQLVFSSVIALTVLAETLRPNVAIGVGIIVLAGLFTPLHQRVTARAA